MTTTDRIRYCSVGRTFDGGEIKIDRPDKEGAGEVCYMYVCVYATDSHTSAMAYVNLCVCILVCVCVCVCVCVWVGVWVGGCVGGWVCAPLKIEYVYYIC